MEGGENDRLRHDLRRLGHWALEGVILWQLFGLGRLTMPLTARSSWICPSIMARSANERESSIMGVKAVIPDLHNFDGDIKATKRQWYAPCCWACLLQKINQKQNIPSTSPAIHGLSQEIVQTQRPILCLLLWVIPF